MDTEVTPISNWSKRTKLALAATALVVAGAAGAFAIGATRPPVEMAPLAPVAIRTLAASASIVTLKGQVTDIYGNKFIMNDASGKMLVDTGRAGNDTTLVITGQAVTVQGRFRRGYVQASFLIGPDGKVVALRQMGGFGSHDGHDRDGRDRSGHNGLRGDDMAPLPAQPVASQATAPAAATQSAPTAAPEIR